MEYERVMITSEERIFRFLKEQGLSDAGVCGAMANMFAESGLNPENLQNSYEKKLGHTDVSYTEAIDSGSYRNFAKDKAGYGLCQWTYSTRKAALLAYAKSAKKSVGDLELQLAFFIKELQESFPAVLSALKSAKTVREASDVVLLQFERPADQSEAVRVRRAKYGQKYFNKYVRKEAAMGFTNSPLVTYTMISPHRTPNRNHAIDTITIHCFVGQVTAKRGCEEFQRASKKASCNYMVGYDGSIGLCVEEKDRSWCTGGTDRNGNPIRVNGISGSSNDYSAVTIEVACESAHPYKVTDKAFAALIELVADICKRNGIKKLLWSGDKKLVGNSAKQNMTVHRWFANKACPGDHLYGRHGEIAAEVNKRLGVSGGTVTRPASNVPYRARVTATDLRIRKGPGTNTTIAGIIPPGVYTIVSEATGQGASKWGKLKSGAGWISLDYAKRI